MGDLRNDFFTLAGELEAKLKAVKLGILEKELIIKALDLGYSAAFCERTADMQESYYESEKYRQGYIKIKNLLEKN
ncbi:MAG: hypothetical protein PHN56_04480 [Candidatus Nanoarchaeia archaeon]|nr:hypothetical protein [Candidatus Nanoarchaeia archaeon]